MPHENSALVCLATRDTLSSPSFLQIESEKQRKESEFPLLNFVEFRPPLYVTSGGNYRSGIPEWRREVPWRQPADQSLDDIVQGGKSSVEDRTGRLPDDTLQRTLQGRLGDSYEPGPEDEYVSPTKDKVGRENGPLRVSPAKVSTLHQVSRSNPYPVFWFL